MQGVSVLKIHSYEQILLLGEFIARTHGCVRNDSETHETVLLSSNISRVRFTVISHTHVRSRFYHIHNVQ